MGFSCLWSQAQGLYSTAVLLWLRFLRKLLSCDAGMWESTWARAGKIKMAKLQTEIRLLSWEQTLPWDSGGKTLTWKGIKYLGGCKKNIAPYLLLSVLWFPELISIQKENAQNRQLNWLQWKHNSKVLVHLSNLNSFPTAKADIHCI